MIEQAPPLPFPPSFNVITFRGRTKRSSAFRKEGKCHLTVFSFPIVLSAFPPQPPPKKDYFPMFHLLYGQIITEPRKGSKSSTILAILLFLQRQKALKPLSEPVSFHKKNVDYALVLSMGSTFWKTVKTYISYTFHRITI